MLNDTYSPLGKKQVDLTNCDLEPIHIPGAIQPHGFIIAVDKSKLISRVSENASAYLKLPANEIIGKNIDLLGESIANLAAQVQTQWSEIVVAGNDFQVQTHNTGDEKILEFLVVEKALVTLGAFQLFQQNMHSLMTAESTEQIVQKLPRMIREVSGYDRVMVYRFDPDWNGVVASEDADIKLEPFLGLNYPASDIPKQARELYTKKLSGIIQDVDYKAVALISNPHLKPLDMSQASLRSISSMHIQYLKNMGVKASFTISILVHGKLWGLVACHHYQGAKNLFPTLRKICETLTVTASFAISALEERNSQIEYDEKEKLAADFFSKLSSLKELGSAIAAASASLLRLTDAQGLCLLETSKMQTWGDCPPSEDLEKLRPFLVRSMSDKDVFCTHHLKLHFELTESIKSRSSGLMVLKLPSLNILSSSSAYLLWFRPERKESIHWAGNPDKAVNKDSTGQVISPRSSFEKWIEISEAHSKRWTESELAAVQRFKSRFLESVMSQQRALAHMAELRALRIEKLSSIGELSAGIAHDLNNILLGILGGAQLVDRASTLEKARVASAKISKYCSRGADIIKTLLKYSRAPRETFVLENAKDLFAELSIFVEALSGQRIEFEFHDFLNGRERRFSGNSSEILQCLLNLVKNAQDAIGEKEGLIGISMDVDTSRNLLLYKVQDNGSGITAENLPRVFDPFFSTKSGGGGTGLGLANVLQIVKNHQGTITVESKLNQGSTFVISLPIAEEPLGAGSK